MNKLQVLKALPVRLCEECVAWGVRDQHSIREGFTWDEVMMGARGTCSSLLPCNPNAGPFWPMSMFVWERFQECEEDCTQQMCLCKLN